MNNPWEEINLSDYENHMRLDSVRQLQALNSIMKNQFEKYDVRTAMIMGIAGGNGLEHITGKKFDKVYGVDINENYIQTVKERYESLSGVLECIKADIINESDKLPKAELMIANLFVEYVGYEAFSKAVLRVKPRFVSCVIQINDNTKGWVSDSPYIHAFDSLESVHCQMEENELTETMKKIGYKMIHKSVDGLPNGKYFVRLDYEVLNGQA